MIVEGARDPPASRCEALRAGGGQARGIERRDIFKDDKDRKAFL